MTSNSAEAAVALAREIVHCSSCFPALGLKKAGIALPQPFAVGKHFAPGGIALLGINPGAAMEGGYKEARKLALDCFASGEDGALVRYWEALSNDAVNFWNPRYLTRIRALELRIDQLLVGNIALCATAGNQYPKRMLTNCWLRHTQRSLTMFAPGKVILMGSASAAFMPEVQQALPSARVECIAHYAHREGHAHEQAECERIRRFLAQS